MLYKSKRFSSSCCFHCPPKQDRLPQRMVRKMATFKSYTTTTAILILSLIIIVCQQQQQQASAATEEWPVKKLASSSSNLPVDATNKDLRRQHTKRHSSSETLDDSAGSPPHYEPLTLDNSEQPSLANLAPGGQPEPEGVTNGRQQQRQTLGKHTLYACEEKQLQIECQLGESIHLIRANYGRFSIGICNEHGQLDWKVNCMSSTSFQTIANSCHGKQSCQLLASNSIFGDSCPGTQKYLEVHYQCVVGGGQLTPIGNRTIASDQQQQATGARYQPSAVTQNQMRPNNVKPNVIQQQQQDAAAATTAASSSSSETNKLVFAHLPTMATQQTPRWPQLASGGATSGGQQQSSGLNQAASLPPWIMEVPGFPTGRFPTGSTSAAAAMQQPNVTTRPHCPETVWRQIRWPATEPGLVVRMPCPAHAHSGNPSEPYPASFACLASANWAQRVQAAGCQSIWLRNLTQRLEAGDSQISVLGELVQRTRPPATAFNSGGTSTASWPFSSPGTSAGAPPFSAVLFGDDIAQIGRIVRRLVDDLGELLNRIGDDKQRVSFAREIVQALVELTNNLANEHHLDAWLDLAPMAGERQRIAGQLVQSLESATVLLAGAQSSPALPAQQQQQQPPAGTVQSTQQQQTADEQESGAFVKVTDNAYVTIRSLVIPRSSGEATSQQQQQQQQSASVVNRSLEVSFPSETSTLGTKWLDERFTIHLQAALSAQEQQQQQQQQSAAQVDVKYQSPADIEQLNSASQTLKIVFVMIKSLGAQMEPSGSYQSALPSSTASSLAANNGNGDTFQSSNGNNRVIVNSNLVSLSIVADSRYKYSPIKVDLSAPIELVFRHLDAETQLMRDNWTSNTGASHQVKPRTSSPRCVYWDTNISDWLSDGCKLIGTNRTHSVCACNHLTTFALLTEWDEQSSLLAAGQSTAFDAANIGQNQQQNRYNNQEQQPRVQLDSVENELILPNKLLYLAKMLDGHLFGSNGDQQQQQLLLPSVGGTNGGATNLRLLIYLSCLISAALLILHLAAAAYNQAHARRLLGAIPAHPPPPLLIANTNTLMSASVRSSVPLGHHQVGSNSDHTSPTYSSDYSAALAATKSKLQAQESSNNHFDNCTIGQSPTGQTTTTTTTTTTGLWRQLNVPIHIIVQLLSLQLLLVLLVESQNYLQRNNILVYKHHFAHHQLPLDANQQQPLNPIGTVTWTLVLSLYYLIAAITCWLAGQLIKLNLNLLCEVRHLKHFGHLNIMRSSASTSSTGSSTSDNKSGQYGGGVTNSTSAVSSSVQVYNHHHNHHHRPQVGGAANLYGAPSTCYGPTTAAYSQQQQQQIGHSSTSPTSSFSSTGQSATDQMNTALSRLEADSARLYAAGKGGHLACVSSSGANKTLLGRLCLLDSNNNYLFVVVHLLPVLAVALIGWLSASRSQAINSLTYTSSFGSQLAYWPLLVDSSSAPFSVLLYYGPAVCLILVGLALFVLRRGPVAASEMLAADVRNSSANSAAAGVLPLPLPLPLGGKPLTATSVVNPYGSSTLVSSRLVANSSNGFLAAAAATSNTGDHQRMALNKQQQQQQLCEQNQAINYYWQTGDSKKATFVCTMLLVLLALHSICWISFFAHIHQALNSTFGSSLHSNNNSILIYAFATTNLLLVLLISWTQRQTLRRAAQLAGLTRLLGKCCCCCGCGSAAAGSRSMALGTHKRARFYRSHNSSSSAAAAPGKGAQGGMKVSPSSQSLFLVSQAAAAQQQRQRQQQQQYQLASANYHYGPSYSSGSSQVVQQHLYQQLTGQQQQHIYDSATAINEQQHQQLNMMQLMQQQQQQQRQLHQMHQNNFTLNRSLNSLQQQRQQYNLGDQRQPMTLKPLMNNMILPMDFSQHHHHQQQQELEHQYGPTTDGSGQLLVLDASNALKQQQQQQFMCHQQQQTAGHLATDAHSASQVVGAKTMSRQSGEADGPLVAFSNSSTSSTTNSSTGSSSSNPPATFGPTLSTIASAAQQHYPIHHPQQQQQQQQQHTEHQLFNQQQDQSQSSSPINCISSASVSQHAELLQRQSVRRSATSVADANQQHQYYSINNRLTTTTAANQSNYTDALRAAMIEQQQQNESSSVSHHFRRANSKPIQQQQRHLIDQSRDLHLKNSQCLSTANNSNNIYDVASNNAINQ